MRWNLETAHHFCARTLKPPVQLFLASIGEECLLGETVEYIREIKPKVKNGVVARDYEVEQNPLRTDERCRLC